MSESSFNFVTYEIPIVYQLMEERNGYKRPSGAVGDMVYASWGNSMYGMNITYSIPPDINSFGSETGNGSWNGIIGVLQREEKDASLIPKGILVSSDVIHYLPIADSIQGTILHEPEIKVHEIELLQTFNVFSNTFWILFIIGTCLLATVFRVAKPGRKFSWFLHLVQITRCYVNQTNIRSHFRVVFINVMALFLTAFCFTELIENLVSTDIVAKDYSTIIDGMDDLLRHWTKYKPWVFKDEPFTTLLSKAENPKHKQVWRKVIQSGPNTTVFAFDPRNVPEMKGDRAYVGNCHYLVALSRIYCGQNSSFNGWIARNAYASMVSSYYLRKQLPYLKRTLITKRAARIAEAGMIYALWLKSEQGIPGTPASGSCEKLSIDDLFGLPDLENRIKLSNSVSLFRWYFVMCLGGIFIVTLEIFSRSLVRSIC